jgi:hypothetical protein
MFLREPQQPEGDGAGEIPSPPMTLGAAAA